MCKSQRSVILAGVLLVSLLSAAPARAQLRPVTWVSTSGDDLHGCSQPAPCRTFQAALSKTIAGGEIRALTSGFAPGQFGSVLIDKSVSIVGNGVQVDSIEIIAGANDVVNLRGLAVDGGGTGDVGIDFRSGTLHIQNSIIRGFNFYGIRFAAGYNNDLFVSDTLIADISVPDSQFVQTAIHVGMIGPQRSGVVLDRVRIENCQRGVTVGKNTLDPPGTLSFLMRNSIVSSSSETAVNIYGESNFAPQAVIDRSAIVANGSGVVVGFPATLHMSNSTVAGNAVGLHSVFGSAFDLRPNNNIVGNVINIKEPAESQ
jgi:hypothetical protein